MARHQAALLALFLAGATAQAEARAGIVHGRVRAAGARAPIADVRLQFTNPADTSEVYAALSREDGRFAVSGLAPRTYRLDAARLGFQPMRRVVRVAADSLDLGNLYMVPAVLPMHGIEVHGLPPPAVQNVDTTEFNAGAVATHPDANAGDLLQKMPGVTIENNSVKVNGEAVQQVLVDGKPYFGEDPAIALQSLPADAIDKIQVFDKASDQSEFTGFDDGQSLRTLNIILRAEKRTGDFGKVYGGGDPGGRYLTGGSAHALRGDDRLTLIGLSDNVNQQNFSAQDLGDALGTPGGSGQAAAAAPTSTGTRRRSGRNPISPQDFLVGQQAGVTSTSSVGANYTADWWKGLMASQSYFFNTSDNHNVQGITRQYPIPQDSVAFYAQNANLLDRQYNQRYDGRFIDTLSTATSVVDEPRAYFQSSRSSRSYLGADRAAAGQPISLGDDQVAGSFNAMNLSDHLVLRHRFAAPGRTVSFDLGGGWWSRSGANEIASLDRFPQAPPSASDSLFQHALTRANTSWASGRFAYTEPLGGAVLLQFVYEPDVVERHGDDGGFQRDPRTGAYTLPDSTLANSLRSTSTGHEGGVGIQVRHDRLNLTADVHYRTATLDETSSLPGTAAPRRRFDDIQPLFRLDYNDPGRQSLRIQFHTAMPLPTLGELQNAVDTSNPLALATGNLALRPERLQSALCRYSISDRQSGQSFFLILFGQHVRDYIGRATLTAARDSVLPGGALLRKDSQLVYPVNLNDYWDANSYATFSEPIKPIHCVLNLTSGATWARSPGLIGSLPNRSDATTFSQGVVLSSNISPKVDFTVSYAGRYTIAHNSLAGVQSSAYYSHVAGLKLNLITRGGIVLRDELTNTLYSGLASGYNPDVLLWNTGVGVKLFPNQSGELQFSASDVLRQNASVQRLVTGTYVEDVQNLTLGPYVMLSFTYTMK